MTETSSAHIATLYRFCAQSMQYPDKGWLTSHYLDSLYGLLDVLQATPEKEAIQTAIGNDSDPIESLQIEYTRLFINGVPHVIAPPYGSVYLDKSLQGLHTEKTLRFYADHGYRLKDGADLPDHITYQLEFLSLLAQQNDQAAETEFLQTIFLPWFGKFYSRVKQDSRHPFYSVIVQLIDYLTKEEDEHGFQLDEA
jgi:TorA maturation chaperone TorD